MKKSQSTRSNEFTHYKDEDQKRGKVKLDKKCNFESSQKILRLHSIFGDGNYGNQQSVTLELRWR